MVPAAPVRGAGVPPRRRGGTCNGIWRNTGPATAWRAGPDGHNHGTFSPLWWPLPWRYPGAPPVPG
jgi:hypothetical protein